MVAEKQQKTFLILDLFRDLVVHYRLPNAGFRVLQKANNLGSVFLDGHFEDTANALSVP